MEDNQSMSEAYEMSPEVAQTYASLLKIQLEIQKLVSMANSCTYDQRIKYWKDKYVSERDIRAAKDHVLEAYENKFGKMSSISMSHGPKSMKNSWENQNFLPPLDVDQPDSQDLPLASGGYDPQSHMEKNLSVAMDVYDDDTSLHYDENMITHTEDHEPNDTHANKMELKNGFQRDAEIEQVKVDTQAQHENVTIATNTPANTDLNHSNLPSSGLDDTQELLRADYISPSDRKRIQNKIRIVNSTPASIYEDSKAANETQSNHVNEISMKRKNTNDENEPPMKRRRANVKYTLSQEFDFEAPKGNTKPIANGTQSQGNNPLKVITNHPDTITPSKHRQTLRSFSPDLNESSILD